MLIRRGHPGDVFLTEDTLPARLPGYGIGIDMFFTRSMLDLEVELFDFHHPSALLPKGFRSQSQPTEGAVVRSQQERTTEEVHSEFPEYPHHIQQLFVGDALIWFSSKVFLTEECHHPLLGLYSARDKVRRIHVQDESTCISGQREDGEVISLSRRVSKASWQAPVHANL